MKHDIELKVNGDMYRLQVDSRRTLLEVTQGAAWIDRHEGNVQ